MKRVIFMIVFFGVSVAFSQIFDMTRFEHEKYGIYKYKVTEDDEVYVDEIKWQLDDNYQITQKRIEVDGSVKSRIEIEFDKYAKPLKAVKFDGQDKIDLEIEYDYNAGKATIRKLDGTNYKSKKLKIEDGIVQDAFALFYTVSGMKFNDEISFIGFSAPVQKAAGMSLAKIREQKLKLPAGEFDCIVYEQAFDGLLALVVPKMYYYIDKESRLLVMFTVSDTKYEPLKIGDAQ